jgi:hypothetical protein
MIFLIFLASTVFLARSSLIIIGLYKDPILHSFEKYGDQENLYYPLVYTLLWLGVFVLSLMTLVLENRFLDLIGNPLIFYTVILGLGPLLHIVYLWLARYAMRNPDLFLLYPVWYREVRERTSRAERRRLAYMWLCLPWRTRLLYDSSDHAFTVWVDLVILATLRPEVDAASNGTRVGTYT